MAGTPGTFRFPEVIATPSAPPAGYALLYIKTDNVLYLQDSSAVEIALGSASSIVELTGDVTATGPGIVAATVVQVGGASAANIAAAVTAYLAATSANTAGTIVKRDGSGDFFAHAITAILHGNADTATTSVSFSGTLVGDVTGTQSATVVSTVGGSSAANVHTAELAANAATPTNTSSTIVKRDAGGNFAATTVTGNLNGNATTATTATNFSGSLSGDVSGTQSSTSVDTVGGSTSSQIHSAELAANAATDSNAANKIVKRDASGDFSAGTISADLVGNVTGNVTGNVSGTSSNVTGVVGVPHGGTNSSTALNNNRVMKSSGGAIVEAAAITPAKALISDANGIPTQSPTTATELGYVSGVTSPIQSQIDAISGAAIDALTGDVSATGPGSVPATVNSVGGSSAANVHSAELAANAATDANTPSTIVKRDPGGNFAAGTITASLTGHASLDIPLTQKGAANGVATLDGSTLVPIAQLPTGAPVTQNTDQANNAGTATTVSKSDHIHNIPTDVPVIIGTTNIQGASTKFSKADHVHQLTDAVTTARLLTGFAVGANTPVVAADSILSAFGKTQAEINAIVAAAINALTGDVTATGPGSVVATIATGAVTDTKASLAVKPAVTVVATTNQALTGTPTIDGQATAVGSIILATAQTTGSENGPWVAAAGAWSRPTWYPNGGTTQAFQFITTFVRLGTTYQGSVWRMTTAGAITIGTTTTTWVVTPVSGNFKSTYTIGPASGAADIILAFANAFVGRILWNPTSSYDIKLPPTQGAAGTFPSNDGAGNLTWTNPLINIDGGSATSVYTPSQLINGGTA